MLSLSLVARLTRQLASPQSATPRGFFFPFDRLALETTTGNFRRGKCKRVRILAFRGEAEETECCCSINVTSRINPTNKLFRFVE